MSRTVKVNPLLVLVSILVGASLGSLIGGIFGAFVAAFLAIPAAGAIQVLVREVWQTTAPQPLIEAADPDQGPPAPRSLIEVTEPDQGPAPRP
jgi:predicted PurR-regulated permease PerM